MTDRADAQLRELEPKAEAPLKVLYISGAGRTASTLLGNILNEIDGFFYVGELFDAWRIIHNRWPSRCGCGELLLDCPIWKPILNEQLPPGHTLSSFAPVVLSWLSSSFRARHTWSLLRGSNGRVDPATKGYLDLMDSTYESLYRVTGARVIVDSSKAPAIAAGLSRLKRFKPYVVHLVRDPRAVAYSWYQRKQGLDRHGILHSVAEWISLTAASDAVVRKMPGSAVMLRYEDFVQEPARAVEEILDLMGEDRRSNPVVGHEVRLGPNHSVFGNPDRFQRGTIEILPDRRWKTAMPRRQVIAVTAFTYPLMRRYGYSVSGAARVESAPDRGPVDLAR